MFGTHSMTVLMAARVYNRRNREMEKVSFSSGGRHRGCPMSGASTNPGIYPGNPSLPKEVREKILSTFKHTLNLYHEGKLDDCVIGCDFILKMDPRFSPARRLLEKAKNPAADVDLIELEAIVATTPVRQQRASADAEKLLVRAVESYNARDFDACINAAEQVLTALPGNVHAAELIEKARRRKEVQSDFEASRSRALALLEARRHKDASIELDRMRELDPEHPAVVLLERRIADAGNRGGGAAARQSEPSLGGMMDLGEDGGAGGHFDSPRSEPKISFDSSAAGASAAGGLDSLSLDSLTLDGGDQSTAVLPPPDFPATRRGPLDLPGAAARGDRGSPGDLWSEGAAAETAPSAAPPPPVRPAPPADSGKAEHEVAQLLRQGDDDAARGDYEAAIEVWSRIFLIDINSVEAVTRIEKARQDMAEGNKQVSETLRQGREAFEAGNLAAARAAFLQVLAVEESEPTARSFLDRIEQEMRGGEPSPSPSKPALDGGLEEVAPPPAEPAPKRKAGRLAVSVNPRVVMIGAAFVVLVAAGSWLVLRQPKPVAPPASPARQGGSLEKATAFFQEGKIPETIAELKRIRPSDADYAKALQLLDTLAKSPSEAAAAAPPPPAGAAGAPSGFDPGPERARGEKALAEKRYIDALKAFSAAAASFQGEPAFAQAMTAAADKVAELTPAVKLYNEAEYETAIPVLWRIYQADKGNQDARSYLLRSYANQGITQLQNGLYQKARQSFEETLALDPQDTEILRHRKFAERYQKGDLDLMGRIYVRHLSHRP
jgi:tetratricopeptide (TPR) repeat protein